jgi:serine protease AprX
MVQSADLTLNNNIVYNQDFTGEIKQNANVTDAHNAPDEFGHGQHVAGIIASSGKSSICGNCTRPLIGIAPGASLINLRVLDENGAGTDSTVIAAINQAIALKSKYNIRVMNLSLGRPVFESYTVDPLCQALEQAWQAGIVVVVAAGNDGRDNSFGTNGYGTITAPGNDPYVITVGAMKSMGTYTRTDDLIASYSSKGPTLIDGVVKPDLVAPGNQVVSLQAGNDVTLVAQYPANIPAISYYQNVPGPVNGAAALAPSASYFTLNGTSMATPVVSAAAADLLQAQPSLTPDQVKARLMLTAYKTFPTSSTATDPTTGQSYLSYYDIFTVGAGYLDIAAALADTDVASASAQSPFVMENSDGTATFVAPNGAVWSTRGVWGTQEVWGTRGVWGTQVDVAAQGVWGASVTLDDSLASALRGVWGTQGVWDTSTETASESIAIAGEN